MLTTLHDPIVVSALAHATSSCTVCFDQTTTSTLFSQLSSVLAGFAFAALLLVVQQLANVGPWSQTSRQEMEQVLGNFCAAFVALLVAAVLYAVVAAEDFTVTPLLTESGAHSGDFTSPRGVTNYLVAAFALGVAVLNLFLGLLHLVRALDLAYAVRILAFVCTTVAPLLTLAYVSEAAESAISFAVQQKAAINWTSWPILTLTVLSALVLLMALLPPPGSTPRSRPMRSLQALGSRLPEVSPGVAARGSLIFTVAAGLFVSVVGRGEAQTKPSVYVILAMASFAFVAIAGYICAVRSVLAQAANASSETKAP